MPGQVTLGGTLNGLPFGTIQFPPITLAANSAGNLVVNATTLANGFNSFTVPTWAVGIIIIPNTSNAVPMTLKGITGDTGIPLSLTGPSLFSLPAVPLTTFGLTSSGAGATITQVVFY